MRGEPAVPTRRIGQNPDLSPQFTAFAETARPYRPPELLTTSLLQRHGSDGTLSPSERDR